MVGRLRIHRGIDGAEDNPSWNWQGSRKYIRELVKKQKLNGESGGTQSVPH
ncbi:hypothetical protein HMPREF1548_01335 [Clostridium sp. KLE 1755]|nr:hypothetical protein HMPREF1548_01335 [Clostridium sp. KLE 1755]